MRMDAVEQFMAQQGRAGMVERVEIPGPDDRERTGLAAACEGSEQGRGLGDRHGDADVGAVRNTGDRVRGRPQLVPIVECHLLRLAHRSIAFPAGRQWGPSWSPSLLGRLDAAGPIRSR